MGRTGWTGWMGRTGWTGASLVMLAVFSLPALPAYPAPPALPSQVPFEDATRDLRSQDPGTRLKAAQMLKEVAYPEAAIPLAALVTDPQDAVQLEAIAAELNIFLAERVVPRKRVGLIVEVRAAILAESAFSIGPLAIGSQPVPIEVLTALRAAARDEHPRVALESLYALGVLGVDAGGSTRRDLLRASGPEIAALTGASDPALRHAALRVMGRLFAIRVGDDPVEQTIGDVVITALNDDDRAVKDAAMAALGAMRYERGVQALTDLFQYYGTSNAADAALDALARIAHPASVPLFAAQLAGKNAARRGIAIEGFARLGDPSKLAGIQAVLDGNRSDGVALAGAFASAMLANDSIDRIAEAATRSKLRVQSRQYLIELAPGRSLAFSRHLLDPDVRVRLDIIDALGLGGDPAALPILEPAMKDRDPQVARAAERAVARLRRAQRTQR